ncbi:MAG: hypothetical protein H7Z16_03730 [Pyrinomonadaceae bacterium]|nr:hypothetical protein [Pyrinomonadaceae bacterium]
MQTNGNIFNGLGRTLGSRWCGLLIGGVGVGAALYYLLGRGRQAEREVRARRKELGQNVVDDRGTGQDRASQILVNLRDRAFEASDERLALALGRPTEEVTAWQTGRELIDDDVIMKARGIAMHRGVSVE